MALHIGILPELCMIRIRTWVPIESGKVVLIQVVAIGRGLGIAERQRGERAVYASVVFGPHALGPQPVTCHTSTL